MTKIKYDAVLGALRIKDTDSKIDNILSVAVSNGDFSSIKVACDYAATVATVDNPYIINICGNFNELPFTIPSYVKLNIQTGTITPIDNSSTFIIMSSYSEIRGGVINSPSISGDTIYVQGILPYIKDVLIGNGGSGCGIKAVNATRLLIRNVTISNVARGICTDNSLVIITTSSVTSASISALDFSNNSTLIINAFVAIASSKDITVTGDDCAINMNACQISIDKLNIENYKNIRLSFASSKEGDEALENVQEFHVGIPEQGYESCFGEGDSYTRGMKVYTYDGVSYVDVSAVAASASASGFQFPNLTDSSIYIASSLSSPTNYLAHYGLKLLINSPAIVGSGNFIIEYWNGTIWADFNYMITDSSNEYIPRAKKIFEQSGATQCRYDVALARDHWTASDPMSYGEDLYWIRIRIENTITTSPIIEQIKLHTNRFEINSDGYTEYYGNSRPRGTLPWSLGLTSGSNIAPSSQSVWISDNISVDLTYNNFRNNSTDRIGFNAYLPCDLDTSSGIVLKYSYITNNASEGDINWKIRWGYTNDADSVYTSALDAPTTAPNEQQITLTTPAPVLANREKTDAIILDISDMVALDENSNVSDKLWVTIERDGPTDTHVGDVAMTSLTATYNKWNEGLHL